MRHSEQAIDFPRLTQFEVARLAAEHAELRALVERMAQPVQSVPAHVLSFRRTQLRYEAQALLARLDGAK